MSNIHKKLHPALFDVPIEAIGQVLVDNVGWLSDVYGKAESITHTFSDGTRKVYPDWFVSGNEYITLLPDDRTGGYAFFLLEEPAEIEREGMWHSPVSIIVWGDMRVASPDERNTEKVKADVLKALRKVRMPGSSMVVERIYEKPESVFRGFDIREVDQRFMMQPYFAFRISGTLYIDEPCNY